MDKKIRCLGSGNPNYRHGGYLPYLMSIEEQDAFQEKFAEYIKQYPRLLEPATRDILKRAIIMEARIKRLDPYIDDPTIDEKRRNTAQKLQDTLIKTWMTLLMRLGVLYTPQQYLSVDKRKVVLSPEELLELRRTRGKAQKKKVIVKKKKKKEAEEA
ncbi:hypothetical protein ES705_44606 [subsurface metagenome]